MTEKLPLRLIPTPRFRRSDLRNKVLPACALAAIGAVAIAFIAPAILPSGSPQLSTVEISRVVYPASLVGKAKVKVSQLVYPNALAWQLSAPADGAWLMPAATVAVGDELFVADAGNNRILRMDRAGQVLATFDSASTPELSLHMPLAIASDGRRLVVADSLAARVLVLNSSGHVQAKLPLPPGDGERAPRPIGVAVTPDGDIVVSDADNHRVSRLNFTGDVLWSAGTGIRAGGAEGFNVPGALTVDQAGNIYVVDTLGGRVVELSPGGAFVRQFGRLGDEAGTLSRPKGVAVDRDGRVFVSDGLLAAVEVFASDGTYLGMIGRSDPNDSASTSVFIAPAGLSLNGSQLLVTDRFAGIIAFTLRDVTSTAPPAGN
jgi:DNA-binding beta-propeller fold protein YncE